MDLHRQVLAPAERAADAGEVDAHALGLEAETRRDLVAVDVQPLRRDVDVDAALAVGDREPGLGAEEGLILDPELVDARDGHVAARVRVAVADHEVADDVRPRVVEVAVAVRPALVVDRLLLHGAFHVDHGLERLVVDLDPLRGSPRLLGMLGGDNGDRLAEVAHLLEREHRLVGELEAVALLSGNVRVRQHGVHARRRQRLAQVDRENACVRVRAAQRVAPEHPGGREVARVRELARRLRDPVDAHDALADPAQGQRLAHSAASRTASKIFE